MQVKTIIKCARKKIDRPVDCQNKKPSSNCCGCSEVSFIHLKKVCWTRSYEYRCPECGSTSPPIDSKNQEFLFKMCYKRSMHKDTVTMRLIKLDGQKIFEFWVEQ